MELDEDTMGFEDLTEGDEEALGDFNKDVAAQEPRFSGVVNQAKVRGDGLEGSKCRDFPRGECWKLPISQGIILFVNVCLMF